MTERQPTPRVEELLEHSEWVWHLARRLVDDDERAHDVVQETWVRALRNPPRIEPARSPRPWLSVVVRSIAAQWQRSDARRDDREREVAKAEALPSAERVRAREEARRVVVDAVLALPEPYREAVVLRYFDGLSPGAVAKRLGVPGSTVRSRLQRAHELLRVRLAAQRRDDARDWLAALIPLVPRRGALAALSSGAVVVSSKLVVLGAASIAAALLVWLAVRPSAPSGAHSAVSVARGGSLGEERTPASDSPSVRAAVVDAQSAPAPGAETKDTSARVRVRVVERSTGKPLPAASVLFGSEDDLGPMRSGDLERDLHEHGEQLVADANGECEFPFRGRRMQCAARSGELWGSTYTTAARGAIVLIELVRDRAIEVQVVDRDGHPVAGVPLVLTAGSATNWQGSTEGPLGIARIRHFDVVAPRPWEMTEMLVTFAFPQSDVRAARVDLAALPSEPLRLELPPHGSIRLHLVHPGGERVSMRYSVTVTARSGTVRGGNPWTDDGELVLPYVGLGLDVRLSGSPATPGALDDFACTVRGLERDGEERVAQVEIPVRASAPHLRLIDADSAPLARRQVNWWLYSGADADPGSFGHAVTDELGNFAVDVDHSRLQFGSTDLRVVVEGDAANAELGATLRIELPKIARDADLGVLRLLPLPRIASGVVLDEREQPVVRAEVDLLRRSPPAKEEDTRAASDAGIAAAVAQRWNTIPLRGTKTDDQGRFTLGGEDPTGELALRASDRGYAGMTPAPIEYGASDVVLHLARTGAVAGSLRLPHPSMASVLWVRVNPTGDADPMHGQGVGVALDGYFCLEQVPAGSHRFTVSLNSGTSRVDLLSIDGVISRPGETTRDPRLADIDLGDLVQLFELELASESGAPVDSGNVWFPAVDGGEGPKRYAHIRAGHATIVSELRELDLLVNAPGFRTLRQRVSAGRTRIALEAGIELALRVDSAVELDPKLAIEAVLRSKSGKPSFDELRVRVPREGGRTRVPFEGEWVITWMLVDRERQAERPLRNATFDVRDDGVVGEAVLDLTQAELDAALAKFGPKKKR